MPAGFFFALRQTLTPAACRWHDEVSHCIRPEDDSMSADDELRSLREELEAVKKERDHYRRVTQALMLKLHPFDPKRLEDEVREVNETGGVPHEKVIETIKARHGLKS
jgi:hypothetical protein